MNVIPAGILMHIPDGFLNVVVAAVCWLLAAVILAVAVANTRRDLDERLVPLAGVMAAFIIAAKKLNIPVAGGTSGHFIGAALACIVLGPWLGLLAMTAVIAVQALLFQDGGLLVMGANILVMGVVLFFLAWGLYRLGRGRAGRAPLVLAGAGAWLSVVAAAAVVALLLAFSGTSGLRVVLPAMVGVHALIGLGEALITVAALSFIRRARPSLLEESRGAGAGGWVVVGLAIALLLVLFAPFASGHPDGLEWVAATTGFLHTAQGAPYSLLANYTIPFLGQGGLSTIVAGLVGVLVVAGLVTLAARALRRRSLA